MRLECISEPSQIYRCDGAHRNTTQKIPNDLVFCLLDEHRLILLEGNNHYNNCLMSSFYRIFPPYLTEKIAGNFKTLTRQLF